MALSYKFIIPVLMTASSLLAKAQVKIDRNETSIVIGNQFLSRAFSIADGHLRPGQMVNKRAGDLTFIPGAGSEEFILNPQTREHKSLDRSLWKAEADSWCDESALVGSPQLSIDGDNGTMWHSWYATPTGGGHKGENNALPHSLTISLGKKSVFRAFGYLPRGGAYGVMSNGNVKGYEFYISNDKKKWTLVKKGDIYYTGIQTVWIPLDKAYTAKYVKLVETSSTNGGAFGACAEFYLTNEVVNTSAAPATGLKASSMKINEVKEEQINGGKRIIFDLAPTAYTNPKDGITSTWDIDMVVEMKDNDHFMRKYLLVKAADATSRTLPIDYIEMESLGTQQVASENKWTRQQAAGGEGGMSAYTITLGQPVYIDGLFFGSEFPQAENEIDAEGMYHTRYYSGKSLRTLDLNEHRLNAEGQFRTWDNVVGATRSATDKNVIRTDFFAYINTIARPIKPRLQYNSWYDWMMNITEDRINSSFREMERGFSQYGLRPMDSYVVDDGWNNYSQVGTEESGNTPNHSGFWEFNSKFPTGLKGASDIAHRYGSGFGIWLGPRGGYNFNQQWGKLLERNGYGTYSTTTYDAVTGDSVYVAKLRDFFLKQQRNYGVNYWKLDGFATQQPQASTNGRYITGGKNGNYYFTEHWERWYRSLSAMYDDASSRNSNLWINLTCYVNPSPWILQWSNSVWIQNSRDMWHAIVDGRNREMDQQLSYRDDRYYVFINQQQLQFPQAHIFNHDPVYGKTGGVAPNAMTDAEFRAYLYMMATRGTAFWEMLYSYNLMNEGNKWMINAEAMNFIDQHYQTLRNSIYFGESPLAGKVYGYSCWQRSSKTGIAEGIVSFRNPSNKEQSYTFLLDKTVGVPENATNLSTNLIMEYTGNPDQTTTEAINYADICDTPLLNYGDTLTLTLKPGEIKLLHFGKKDTSSASPITARSTQQGVVVLTLDKPVIAQTSNFELLANGKRVAKASAVYTDADYRTLHISFNKKLTDDKLYAVRINGLTDWQQNVTRTTSPTFYFAPDSILIKLEAPVSLYEQVRLGSEKSFQGTGDFSIDFTLSTSESDVLIAKQSSAYSIAVQQGKLCFKVGKNLSFTSSRAINDTLPHRIVCLRERNGMIKIYIDGELQGTTYNQILLTNSNKESTSNQNASTLANKEVFISNTPANENLPAGPVILGQNGKKFSLKTFILREGALPYNLTK